MKVHTTSFSKVLAAEESYIKTRRKKNNITEEEAEEGTWGLACSNGGARAAVLSLGVMRKLMERNFFRRMDYLSTVEGSGFMASCLSSLLTGSKSSKGKFGSNSTNTPFCPNTNANEDKKTSKVTPNKQIAYLKNNIHDVNPRFWKNLGKGRGLFGIGLSGFTYGLMVLLLILFAWMALHHSYLYWVSDGHFQEMIAKHQAKPMVEWTGINDVFSWTTGLVYAFWQIEAAIRSPEGWQSIVVAACVGFLFSLAFFLFSLRPALGRQVSDVVIEVKVKRFYYLGFFFTYIGLLIMGWVIMVSNAAYWLVFVMPIGLMSGVLVSSIIGAFITRQLAVEDENRRALVAEISTAGFLMLLAAVAFPFLLITFLLTGGVASFICSILFLAIGAQVTFIRIKKLGMIKAMRWRGNFWSNLFLGLFVALAFASIGKLLLYLAVSNGGYTPFWFIMGLIIPGISLLILGLSVQNVRHNSLHNHFKNRKGKIYLSTVSSKKQQLRDDTDLLLHEIGDYNSQGPYLILNAALNVHSSSDSSARKRKAVPFVFTKYFIGSHKTGYARTESYDGGKFTLADAMMCSGATYHSGMGVHGFYGQAFLFTLLNLRQGAWLPNPWYYRTNDPGHSRGKSRFLNFIREFMNRFSTRALAINISGGIHTGDYWGLTSLIERRCENIILCDFRSPKDLVPGELDFTAIRAIAARYNARLGEAQTDILRPDSTDSASISEGNVLSCTLTYEDGTSGRLYYLKSALSSKLPTNILDYHKTHTDFPTRFNSEIKQPDLQFNSFVELGENMAAQFLQLRRQNKLDDFSALLGERISQIDEEMGENEVRHENMSELEQLLKTRQNQIDKQLELGQQDIESLIQQEELLIKKLTRYREENVLVSDIEKKFELEQRIEMQEADLKELRYQIEQRKSQTAAKGFSSLSRLINNMLRLIQKNQLHKDTLQADREQLVKQQKRIEQLLTQNLGELNESALTPALKSVEYILNDIDQKLNNQGEHNHHIDISKIRKALIELLEGRA